MTKKIFILTVLFLVLAIFIDYRLNEFNHIYIQIHGEVKKPGVYKLPIGSRLYDAVKLAGGFNNDYKLDLRQINLSAPLKDGENILIGNKDSKEEYAKSNYNTKNNFIDQQKIININTANISELDNLPGIGRSTAQKIINSRPFESIEDIKKVSGIGDKKFEQIKNLITVD